MKGIKFIFHILITTFSLNYSYAQSENQIIQGKHDSLPIAMKEPCNCIMPTILDVNITDIKHKSANIQLVINPENNETKIIISIDSRNNEQIMKTETSVDKSTENLTLGPFKISHLNPGQEYRYHIELISVNSGITIVDGTFKTLENKALENTIISNQAKISNEEKDQIAKEKNKYINSIKIKEKDSIYYANNYFKSRKKQISKFVKLKSKLNSSNYTSDLLEGINTNNIYDMDQNFKFIENYFYKLSYNEIKALYILSDNLTVVLKVFKNPKKIKNIPGFNWRYIYLNSNIESLRKYVEQLYLSFNLNSTEHVYELVACATDEINLNAIEYDFPEIKIIIPNNINVCVKALGQSENGSFINRRGLTIRYNYAYLMKDKEDPFEFKELTPSCDKMLPGKWKLWLENRFENKRASELKYLDLTNLEKSLKHINVEIPSY